MTSPAFALYLTCLFLGKMAQTTDLPFSSERQETRFVSATTKENLTLQCFHEGAVAARLYWYKQTLGQKPRLISTFYMYDKKRYFYGEFKNNSRFALDTENGQNHLTIKDLRISDSGTYYCISCYLYTLEISESNLVNVKDPGLNVPAFVHQSASETVQLGGSVTLNCTVHTATCEGEQSVYWFKSSKDAHPGLIYTHGAKNDQCARDTQTQTHSCVYNLPMKSLNHSHAGTYYCAVASCGHILFGGGTKLDVEVEVDSSVLVYFWHGASTFTAILVVLLAFTVCMMNSNCKSTESQARIPAPSASNAKSFRHAEKLYYAAFSVNLHNRSKRQRDPTWSECVYYSVKN
ncbi:uncharacterized protein LOC131989422 isoform X2 [Centropristis striata]|uniref:uncharacterized protein LOC131989422 isoform X2 n=1 Tax=Centropristis striata TaxID=184440 RepID=UPI0027DFA4AA|nr:uncharacterized protein LOC131989422 isoform X2 [Centropristis striata]